MSNECKTGWATITHKNGSSMTGEIVGWHVDMFDIEILGDTWGILDNKDVTITYIDRPMPALPDKPGSVIEAADGVRFTLSDQSYLPWFSTVSINGFIHDEETVLAHCRKVGGFTVLLEGK